MEVKKLWPLPAVGRIVHYIDHSTDDSRECCAAIITKVWPLSAPESRHKGTIDITVFTSKESWRKALVPWDWNDTRTQNTWHWPEDVPVRAGK